MHTAGVFVCLVDTITHMRYNNTDQSVCLCQEGLMNRQARGDETRNRILDAALTCFSRNGYDASGVAEICELAQVSKGAFYYHFASKQTLFLALLDRWLADLDLQLEAVTLGTANVPGALLQMADMAGGVFGEARGQLPMFLEFWSKASRDPLVWQATVEPYRRYRAYFAGLIRAGIQQGSLRAVDADEAAQVVVSTALGLILQGLLDPQGADWQQMPQVGIRMLLDGLRPPSAANV
jgi:AcrR family transcriptional regulator